MVKLNTHHLDSIHSLMRVILIIMRIMLNVISHMLIYLQLLLRKKTNSKTCLCNKISCCNFQNIFPCRVKVLTTAKTYDKVYYKFSLDTDFGGMVEDYPYVDYSGSGISKTDSEFYDVMVCGNAYLAALGGDFDGDMLYLKPVFSQGGKYRS